MSESPEDLQFQLWSSILRAIARAVDGTFISKKFASPSTKGVSPEERRLPRLDDLLDRLNQASASARTFSQADMKLIHELVEEAFLRGHEARERREVRRALVRTVEKIGEDVDLRAVLVNNLLLDGFGRKRLWWDFSFEEFAITDRELDAIRESRPKKKSLKELRRQYSRVERKMGWAKHDKTRRRSIHYIELAEHFHLLTRSTGKVAIQSSATGKRREARAPLTGREAIKELSRVHDINSEKACLRALQRVRKRSDQFLAKFEHLAYVGVVEARLHAWIPDLSALP